MAVATEGEDRGPWPPSISAFRDCGGGGGEYHSAATGGITTNGRGGGGDYRDGDGRDLS